MSIRNTLPAILRGEEAPDVSHASRAQLEALVERAKADDELVIVRDECAARMKQDGASLGVEYLLAEACWRNGESERAHQTLLSLGEKLAHQSEWEPLAAIADHALAILQSQAAARLLIQAHEGLRQDPQRIEALKRAWVILSDDLEIGLLVAVRLGDAGRHDERRALLLELIPKFASSGRYAGLEEAALEFVEKEDLEALIELMHTLPAVAGQGAHAESAQLLEIAFPPIARAGRAAECLAALRETATLATQSLGATGGDPFRAPLVAALKQGPGAKLPDPESVFAHSGIEDRMKPLLPALDNFDRIAALPPGRSVFHDAFGAGRVSANDGETVAVDFSHARGHRMPYAAARRTLARIEDDDLRLLMATDPKSLARLCKDEPVEIVLRALRALGGGAEAQKLRVFLVGSKLIPASEWSTFWRRARVASEKDPRIDSSRAFEQYFGIAQATSASDADDAPPLPALEPRKSVRANLATLRKFLSQHPSAEAALADRFGRYVERVVLDDGADLVDRARAGLHFARWRPERSAEWTEVLKTLWEKGLTISSLTTEDEQLALLEVSHRAGVEADAILSALDSRFSSVRDAADRFREQLDDHGRALLREALLKHAPRHPGAALRLIEAEMATAGAQDPWRLFAAAIVLVEERPKTSVAQKVMRWLEPGGSFDDLLIGLECPEEIRLQIRLLLRQWRSSDRLLFPTLEALERLGLSEEAEILRGQRQRKTERLFDRVGQQSKEATDASVMTRATWARLNAELERLQRELRTTIPASIEKARELGDLRENAEFHSAKLKQATVSKLVASLQLRLRSARFVDEADFRDGVVGLGTEVVLESDDDVLTYWILGEGEHHHGDHVISFQAPVGRSLMGRAIGEEVDLRSNNLTKRYRVVSVERKLPATEPESTS